MNFTGSASPSRNRLQIQLGHEVDAKAVRITCMETGESSTVDGRTSTISLPMAATSRFQPWTGLHVKSGKVGFVERHPGALVLSVRLVRRNSASPAVSHACFFPRLDVSTKTGVRFQIRSPLSQDVNQDSTGDDPFFTCSMPSFSQPAGFVFDVPVEHLVLHHPHNASM